MLLVKVGNTACEPEVPECIYPNFELQHLQVNVLPLFVIGFKQRYDTSLVMDLESILSNFFYSLIIWV